MPTLDLPESAQKVFRERLLGWFDSGKVAHPWRVDWQRTGDPYFVWVSEIMLQQTVIKAAVPAYIRFTTALPNVAALAAASVEEVKLLARGLGYYRRFGFMHAAAKILAERGEYPSTAEEWQKLPGIGPYTAAAISSICFGISVACVDGNVERVLCRLLNIQRPVNDPNLKPHYRRIANQLVSRDRAGDFNQAMMELGQLICTPTQPLCKSCPVSEFCKANDLGSQELAPGAKIKSKKVIDVDMALIIPTKDRKIGLSKRPHGASFLRGHEGFSTYLRQLDASWKRDGDEQGLVEAELFDCGRFRHTITNHRMNVRVYRMDWSATSSLHPEAWIDESEADRAIVSNLDRKALRLLQRRTVRAQSFSSF